MDIRRSSRPDVLDAYSASSHFDPGFEVTLRSPTPRTYGLRWTLDIDGNIKVIDFVVAIEIPSSPSSNFSSILQTVRHKTIAHEPVGNRLGTDHFLARPNGQRQQKLTSVQGNRPRHAAITIISKNYFSHAITLANSYRKHHPNNEFIIVLVDRADGYLPKDLPPGIETIEIARFRIPDLDRLIYRYTLIELNTAVKPFVLSELFVNFSYETLVYLDPDIWIFRHMTEVYQALEDASIILTPHMRRPYYDNYHPNDLSILQSGTYNLGFIGLRAGKSCRYLLDWWMSKLYRDCIVDVANGLFVDQKWIDLVPAFFPDVCILHDPTYNVAYWNLHERRLSGNMDGWRVDGKPLSFFHFSGYIPISPGELSKHQNRHQLAKLPELMDLTTCYGNALFANGYETSMTWPYAFETLSNGVHLPMTLVRDAMQWASITGVSTPSPDEYPNEFCRFLMSRGQLPNQTNVVLLYSLLLKRRKDVADAFPQAINNSDDKGFRDWLMYSGIKEECLADLIPYEGEEILDYVADAFCRLRLDNRTDVLTEFQDMWSNDEVFDKFVDWMSSFGIDEMGFERTHAERLSEARAGTFRILNIYFMRGDLQARFPTFWEDHQRVEFADWLRRHRHELNLSLDAISLFSEFTGAQRELLEKMRFLYQHHGKKQKILPSIYAVDERRYSYGITLGTDRIFDWLAHEASISPADHFVAHFGRDLSRLADFGKCSVPGLPPRENFAFVKKLREALTIEPSGLIANVAGFLTAPSGMGEAGRSLLSTLQQTNLGLRAVTLPHVHAQSTRLPNQPTLFGWPSGVADMSITVANADSTSFLETVLPSIFWARMNIGYWLWETEALPQHFADADTLFDEIWTPSRYSADAIRKTSKRAVRVLPISLEFAAIDQSKPNRERFGLPTEAILFGFLFDPDSILERKNVTGLIEAFRAAFRDDDNCYLILKVNGTARGSYAYERIRARADSDRILFLEATLSRADTYDFLKSLDAYVSLHRAEGFGLTCAESMALGLPVVASDYSGNLEFMNTRNSLLVPTSVIETDRPHGPYPSGTRWGDPDLDAASQILRTLLDEETRQAIGLQAAHSVRRALAVETLAARAKGMIAELLSRDPRRKSTIEGHTSSGESILGEGSNP